MTNTNNKGLDSFGPLNFFLLVSHFAQADLQNLIHTDQMAKIQLFLAFGRRKPFYRLYASGNKDDLSYRSYKCNVPWSRVPCCLIFLVSWRCNWIVIRSEVPFLFVELNPFFWDTNTINLITDYVWRVLVGSRKKKRKRMWLKILEGWLKSLSGFSL